MLTKKVSHVKNFSLPTVATHGKSFKTYEAFAKFEQNIHKVDLGSSYLDDKAGAEITEFLSRSILLKNITEPLNPDTIHYYSVMFDGSSSMKTLDEKELFVMKYCAGGVPSHNIMSREEPDEANAKGLESATKSSFDKLKLEFDRKEKEIGLCSDSARVNISLYNRINDEIGEHYLLILCTSHKFELALHNAFKISELNSDCEEEYRDIYYLFRKATLKWRLFKRQALFLGMVYLRYKRPDGTRWVEHQVITLKSHLKNLPIFIRFANQQTTILHNKQMKDSKAMI